MANDPKVLSSAQPMATTAPADGSTHELDDGRVIQGSPDAPRAAVIEMYTPPDDVIETGPDGTAILLAAKGVPIPQVEAERLGLVKPAKKHGPQETKE